MSPVPTQRYASVALLGTHCDIVPFALGPQWNHLPHLRRFTLCEIATQGFRPGLAYAAPTALSELTAQSFARSCFAALPLHGALTFRLPHRSELPRTFAF
jgi:hypothetical protein